MPSGTEAELVPLRIAKHQIAIAGRDVRRDRARRPAGSGCRSGCWPTTSAHGSGIRCRRAAELLLFIIPVPMAGGALLASGATVLGVLVLGAGLVIACLGGVRGWRTRLR